MCFFENDYFLTILKTYKEQTFPMLVPVIVDQLRTIGTKFFKNLLSLSKPF